MVYDEPLEALAMNFPRVRFRRFLADFLIGLVVSMLVSYPMP
jgi:hypothetical protein